MRSTLSPASPPPKNPTKHGPTEAQREGWFPRTRGERRRQRIAMQWDRTQVESSDRATRNDSAAARAEPRAPVSTRDRPARTGADVRIEESATNGEVCLALRPYRRASKLRFRSERGRCFEDDSVEQRAARQLPGRPPQHRTRAAKRNAQLGARMPRRTVCRQLSAARKSTSTRKPPASTLLALTAAPIASHRSRTSARPMPVPFTTSLLSLAR